MRSRSRRKIFDPEMPVHLVAKPDSGAKLDDTVARTIEEMVARGRERGYVTYDELNTGLPPDRVSSEQIEDVIMRLHSLGIEILQDVASPRPAEGKVDYASLSREHLARYPKIRAALAK